ncbi:MAG: hypothetical protein LBH58_02270 [Tannerellaceae bacterium]|jgi:uncharacterized membrane protein SirB2|nr:hypothetical protein [Tannerellaceae bacterium]
MRINKDLVDAVMMLSSIVLVLVGTTDFTNESEKKIIMGILGIIAVLMVVFRFIGGRQAKDSHDGEPEH